MTRDSGGGQPDPRMNAIFELGHVLPHIRLCHLPPCHERATSGRMASATLTCPRCGTVPARASRASTRPSTAVCRANFGFLENEPVSQPSDIVVPKSAYGLNPSQMLAMGIAGHGVKRLQGGVTEVRVSLRNLLTTCRCHSTPCGMPPTPTATVFVPTRAELLVALLSEAHTCSCCMLRVSSRTSAAKVPMKPQMVSTASRSSRRTTAVRSCVPHAA